MFWFTFESSGGCWTTEFAEFKLPRMGQVWSCTPVVLRDQWGRIQVQGHPGLHSKILLQMKQTPTSKRCMRPAGIWQHIRNPDLIARWTQSSAFSTPVCKTIATEGRLSFCLSLYRSSVTLLFAPEWHTSLMRTLLEKPVCTPYWMFTCLWVRYPKSRDKSLILVSPWLHESLFLSCVGPNHWTHPLWLK